MAARSKYARAALTEMTSRPLPKNLCESYRGNTLDRIYTKLGLAPGGHVPKDFKGKFDVDGHTVIVFASRQTSLPEGRRGGRVFKPKTVSGRTYSLSRMFFQLKGSGKLVPIGRVRQVAACKGGGSLSGLGGTRKRGFYVSWGRTGSTVATLREAKKVAEAMGSLYGRGTTVRSHNTGRVVFGCSDAGKCAKRTNKSK
jgi:hypothetical protein